MTHLRAFWQLLGELDAQPGLCVTWDDALYDEPEDGQFWGYVHAEAAEPPTPTTALARISSSQPVAFVLESAPEGLLAALSLFGVQTVPVADLDRATQDITGEVRHLGRSGCRTPRDLDRLLGTVADLGLKREQDDEYFGWIILTTDAQGQWLAAEHLYLPLALTVQVTPPELDHALRQFGHTVIVAQDWPTPHLSLDPVGLTDQLEDLGVTWVAPSEWMAFSAASLVDWLRQARRSWSY